MSALLFSFGEAGPFPRPALLNLLVLSEAKSYGLASGVMAVTAVASDRPVYMSMIYSAAFSLILHSFFSRNFNAFFAVPRMLFSLYQTVK